MTLLRFSGTAGPSHLSRLLRLAVLGVFALAASACGDDAAPPTDSSTPLDSSVGDSAPPPDSSTPVDADVPDGGSDASSDAAADASSDGSAPDAAPADAATDAAATGCTSNAECRAFSDYCDGCNCRALLVTEADPVCTGTTVTCFVDPCSVVGPVRCNLETGACEIAPAP